MRANNESVFEYLYRDAGNWKTYGVLPLLGHPSPAQAAAIRQTLDGGCLFVPEQVGISPLQRRHLQEHEAEEDDLDHAFHEFFELREAGPTDMSAGPAVISVEVLVQRFAAIGPLGWDPRHSPFGQ